MEFHMVKEGAALRRRTLRGGLVRSLVLGRLSLSLALSLSLSLSLSLYGNFPLEGYNPRSAQSSLRKPSTSMTRPMAWKLPRSESLVTTAGLISTHTVVTPADSRLPVAMPCSIDDSTSTRSAPL